MAIFHKIGNNLSCAISKQPKLPMRDYFNVYKCSKDTSIKTHFSTTITSRTKDSETDDLTKNPYYGKYAHKIEDLKQSSATLEYLKQIPIEGNVGSNKNHLMVTPDGQLGTGSDILRHNSKYLPEKKLEKILNIDELNDKCIEEISKLWNDKHDAKKVVTGILPAEVWQIFSSRIIEHNTFLLPLPRNQGYEFFVVQFDGNEAHFTSLYNYQVYGETSPECLNLVHYTEILEKKGLVLMSGDYDMNLITYEEASFLALQLVLYYGVTSETKKLAHLQRFTYHTEEFSHFDLIAELEDSKNIPHPSLLRK